jgi:hypothetical protein
MAAARATMSEVLTDDAYAKLLDRLAHHQFDRTSPELRTNILDFYSDLSLKFDTKREQDDWKDVLNNLERLKAATPVPVVAATPLQ